MPMSWGSLSVMEKQHSHSPLPWHIKNWRMLDKNNEDVMSSYEMEENVLLIIKSVNNHDALTKALKTCVVALYAHPELSSRAREAIQEAEAVLGQLEGKE